MKLEQLPSHIANAPTLMTDKNKYWCPQCGTDGTPGNQRDIDVVLASEYKQLEHELLYANEVMEKLAQANIIDFESQERFSSKQWEQLHPAFLEALSAYTNYKSQQKEW